MIDLPIIIPHTAAGVALLMVFGRRGLLGEPLASVGVYFTENLAGIVIAMLFVSLPLLVDTARETFARSTGAWRGWPALWGRVPGRRSDGSPCRWRGGGSWPGRC